MLIQKFTDILHLDDVLGCSPIFYDPDAHFWEHDSLYRLFIDQLIPTTVYNTTLVNQQFFVTNTQTLRYYLYQGSVTLNDVWTISPFKDKYLLSQHSRRDVARIRAYLERPPSCVARPSSICPI